MDNINALRKEIVEKTIAYQKAKFANQIFVPRKTRVNYAGRVFDEQ